MIKKRILSMLVLLLTAAMSAVAQLYAPPGSGGDEKTITLSPNNLTLTVGEEATVSYSLSGMGTCIPSWRITEGGSYISFKSLGSGNPKTVIANAPGTATIECYHEGWTSGYCTVTVTAPATYTVTLKEGTEDATSWQGKAGTGEYQDLPLEGVAAGTAVSVKYNGTKKVKSVKAKKKAAAAPALNLTSPAVGQVIGDDGKNYAYGSLPDGVTAVAKICYVSGSNGLALALTDEANTMDWSTAITTCAAHTPAFTGGTWKLATQGEWDNMITAAGSYSALCEGFSSVGGTNMIPYYSWSSTEFDSNGAWSYEFGDGEWSADGKGEVASVRACLAW